MIWNFTEDEPQFSTSTFITRESLSFFRRRCGYVKVLLFLDVQWVALMM
jgi:hypothetical protein